MLGRFQTETPPWLGRESEPDALPVLWPGQTAVLRVWPATEVQIVCRHEGRGDPATVQVWSGRSDHRGELVVTLPPDVPLTYDGLLFRVRWELQGAGQARRLVVGLPDRPDPYAALGLAFNPFRAEEIPARQMDWAGVAAAHWLERGYSAAPGPGRKMLVQLLGVKGAGKSSHLAHWRSQQPGPGYYCPPLGLGRWQPPPLAPICYWDEACRIPLPLLHWGLSRVARAGHTVCVGTHRDLSAEAQAQGLEVRTIHLHGISADEIMAWTQKRIASARVAGTFTIPLALADQLAQDCGDSWREIATRLHIWTAQQAQQQSGQAPGSF